MPPFCRCQWWNSDRLEKSTGCYTGKPKGQPQCISSVLLSQWQPLVAHLCVWSPRQSREAAISLHGRKYTWSSSSSSASPTLVKLDRVFCTVDWEDMFPDCLLQSSASDDSDHCPLILGLRDITTTKRRFHFESFWTNMDGFLDTVEAAWSSVQSHPCPMQTLSLKLKATARALQSWSQKKIGHITS